MHKNNTFDVDMSIQMKLLKTINSDYSVPIANNEYQYEHLPC